MKAYRDRAKNLYGITNPEVVAPTSIHAAIEKSAHILGCKLRYVSLVYNLYVIKIL